MWLEFLHVWWFQTEKEKKKLGKYEATVIYTEVLTSGNFLVLLSHKSWLAEKSMLLHITDFMKFWDALSYRLTVAPLVQHHSVDTYKTIINFARLCPAVVSYIINTVLQKQINSLLGIHLEEEVTRIYTSREICSLIWFQICRIPT